MIIWLVLFGALGVLARYGVGLTLPSASANIGIVWSVLAVNAFGSFLSGFLSAKMDVLFDGKFAHFAPAIMIGFLGGFTTFSAFANDTVRFLLAGNVGFALTNVILNNTIAISLCYLGVKLAK